MQKSVTPPRKTTKLEDFHELLVIEKDDLEGCLISQAESFWQIANAQVQAAARRDGLKLEIEELHAALDRDIREKAAKHEEKTTEAGIQQRIKDDVDMRDLRQQHLAAAQSADEWAALKEAFYQRGYMLRELVALTLRQLSLEGDIAATERATNELRAKRGDQAIDKVRAAREAAPMKRLGRKDK